MVGAGSKNGYPEIGARVKKRRLEEIEAPSGSLFLKSERKQFAFQIL